MCGEADVVSEQPWALRAPPLEPKRRDPPPSRQVLDATAPLRPRPARSAKKILQRSVENFEKAAVLLSKMGEKFKKKGELQDQKTTFHS